MFVARNPHTFSVSLRDSNKYLSMKSRTYIDCIVCYIWTLFISLYHLQICSFWCPSLPLDSRLSVPELLEERFEFIGKNNSVKLTFYPRICLLQYINKWELKKNTTTTRQCYCPVTVFCVCRLFLTLPWTRIRKLVTGAPVLWLFIPRIQYMPYYTWTTLMKHCSGICKCLDHSTFYTKLR